jgi:hypothetical protein
VGLDWKEWSSWGLGPLLARQAGLVSSEVFPIYRKQGLKSISLCPSLALPWAANKFPKKKKVPTSSPSHHEKKKYIYILGSWIKGVVNTAVMTVPT